MYAETMSDFFKMIELHQLVRPYYNVLSGYRCQFFKLYWIEK